MRKIIIIGMLLLSACTSSKFNNFEKAMLDVYNAGDTLIFESDTGILDTMYIMRKDIQYADWNPINVDDKIYRRLIGRVLYYNDFYKKSNEFVNLTKYHPDSINLSIYLKNILISFPDGPALTEKSFDKFKVEDSLYRFETTTSKGKSQYLYWHLRHGVTEYMSSDSIVWKRINIKH